MSCHSCQMGWVVSWKADAAAGVRREDWLEAPVGSYMEDALVGTTGRATCVGWLFAGSFVLQRVDST